MERELWKLLYAIVERLDKHRGKRLYSAGDVVMVYIWAVICDRPMDWAVHKRNWPEELWNLAFCPSQSTLSRRMRTHQVQELMTEVEQVWLGLVGVRQQWMRVIDGKPLGVSGVSKDPDAGYGRGAGGKQKGYKLYAVWARGPLPLTWGLAPINVSEKVMAGQLIPTLPRSGYLLGDSEYDSNALYDLAHEAEHQLLVRKRQKQHGVGHRKQSPYRLRSIHLLNTAYGRGIYRFRREIERDFGNLTSFGGGLTCLPPWVRRFTRVRNWLQAKLLINAARWYKNHPDKLALE